MSSRAKAFSLIVAGLVAGLVLGTLGIAGAAPDEPVLAVPAVVAAEAAPVAACPGFGGGAAVCGQGGTCAVTGEDCVPGEECVATGEDCAPGEQCGTGACGVTDGGPRGGRADGEFPCGGPGSGGGCGQYNAAPPVTY